MTRKVKQRCRRREKQTEREDKGELPIDWLGCFHWRAPSRHLGAYAWQTERSSGLKAKGCPE